MTVTQRLYDAEWSWSCDIRPPTGWLDTITTVTGVPLATAAETPPVALGRLRLWPPVVLAPMAGVTDVPFRALCRRFGAGLYVNQMVSSRAYVEGDAKTLDLARFGPDERPRSIQLYGTEPASVGAAVALLVDRDQVDHIDMNFGCPVPKVTRHGGGAAVPAKRRLFRAIVAAAVAAAGEVPVTVKFRMGVDDGHLTFLDAGRIAEDEGCAAVALHARTAEQLYAPSARWDAIGELKAHVSSIPVLGNGDIWEAADAIAMMDRTGCDGVVIGRGCLGRPWLFEDLAAAFAGRPVRPPRRLGVNAETMVAHARLVAEWSGPGRRAIAGFRKHALWYLTGYPVGGDVRLRFAVAESVSEIEDAAGRLDPTLEMWPGGMRQPRSHRSGPRPVRLPAGWLADPDDDMVPAAAAEDPGSGG
jgi:nifR3 family TIM-barrel protein